MNMESYITGTISKNLIGKIRAITMMNIGYKMKINLCINWYMVSYLVLQGSWKKRHFVYLFVFIYLF